MDYIAMAVSANCQELVNNQRIL